MVENEMTRPLTRKETIQRIIKSHKGFEAKLGVAKETAKAIVGEPEKKSLLEMLASYERYLIRQALDAANGNQSKAAEILRISERSFKYRFDKHKMFYSDIWAAAKEYEGLGSKGG